MKYETILKLKEAGFPLRIIFSEHLTSIPELAFSINGQWYLSPTLSEIIYACGDEYHALEQKVFGGMKVEGGKWIAYSNHKSSSLEVKAHIFQQGETPEEAVAKLWLQINKK